MFYEEVFRKLGEQKVRYAVAGGVALVLHGVVRMTADLDLIVDLDYENLRKFIVVMNELGYRPRTPGVAAEDLLDPNIRGEWITGKGMEVFSFQHRDRQINQVDVFITEPVAFDILAGELVRITARDVAVPVVSRTHLKMLKRISGRPQDLADIEAIEELEEMEKKDG